MKKELVIEVKGEVDCGGNTYDVLLAKLHLICAEYDLELTEYWENE